MAKMEIKLDVKTEDDCDGIKNFESMHNAETVHYDGATWTIVVDDTQEVYDFLDSAVWINHYAVL